MKSSTLVIVAIGVVIGLALTPVISNSVAQASADPTCAAGLNPVRSSTAVTISAPNAYGAGNGAIIAGNIVCLASGTAAVTGTPGPLTLGGRLSSLYAGTGTAKTTASPPGPFIAAGTIVGLVPLAYIFAILLFPVGMIGKRYLRSA